MNAALVPALVSPRDPIEPQHELDPRSQGPRILGERLFRDTLVRERRRADRLMSPFAVIVVDRSHLPADDEAWGVVFEALMEVSRGVDMAGWLDRGHVLGVVLPHMSIETAATVVRRLRRSTATYSAGRRGTVSVRLYVHAAGGPVDACYPSVDVLMESFPCAGGRPASEAAKRVLDVAGATVLLILFLPVIVIAFLAVKFTSPGPSLFRQTRIGRRGEPFTMLKFRSMRTDAGDAIHKEYVAWFITASDKQPRLSGDLFKMTDDPRITVVGRWLRRTSIDELPQFWNVLCGEMSLVGPRPPLPFELERYQPWHRRRVLEAKPGITGAWQVKGRSRTTFDEMVRMDLEYVRTRSLWTDMKILAATPFAMVKGAC